MNDAKRKLHEHKARAAQLKILVADDHSLIRAGLKQDLQELANDLLVLEADCGTGVINQLSSHRDIDIILLDLFMPKTDGFALLQQICDNHTGIPVIVLSATDEHEHMRKSIDYGASGFIPKSTPRQIMMSAIRLVLSGGVYIPPDLLKTMQSANTMQVNTVQHQENSEKGPIAALTHRQMDVLKLIALGNSNKEIARKLGLSEYTVKNHVTAVLKTLAVDNRIQAVLALQELDLASKDNA